MLDRTKIALSFLLLVCWSGGSASAAEIQEPVYSESDYQAFTREDCMICHGDEELEGETERGATLSLHVDETILAGSVHEDLLCTDCHRGAKDFEDAPHNDGRPLELNCGGCHDDVVKQYDRSIHGIWHAKGDTAAANCKDCHGNHDILPSSDRKSRTNAFNLHKTCAKCHESQVVLDTRPIGYDKAVPDFVDSIHGRALLVDGLIVAPSCNDCHGVHDILPNENPDSRVSREAVPDTCGRCHVLVEDVFNASIHGRSLTSHDTSAPICTTCH
ncbi:MAG: hypothetical protein OEM49_12020, partial [Myxococcales bacterium]|nr:hypothetical protein [Myxococcales bacterium]